MARLARKVLVGDLKEDFRITVKMIRMLPHTPRQNVKLEICKEHICTGGSSLHYTSTPDYLIDHEIIPSLINLEWNASASILTSSCIVLSMEF